MTDYFDFSGDGTLSLEDANIFADRFTSKFHGSDEKKAYFKKVFHDVYSGLLKMDKDGNGHVNQAEINAFLHDMIDHKKTDDVVGAFVKVALDVIDTDGDGKISKQEYLDYIHLNPRNPVKNAEHAYSKLDRNGDGHISIKELYDNFTEFYTSTDPHANGNWLYGDF